MKQYMTKRNLLIAAAALLLIAFLVLLLLSGGGRKEQTFQGGEDTAYPYRWTELADGSLRLTLCDQAPAGCFWQLSQGEHSSLQVTWQEGTEDAYLIQPTRVEDALLRFVLADETFPEDRSCELLVTVEVQADGDDLLASVSGHRLIVPEGTLRGGEEFDCPYRIWRDGDQRLVLGLSDGSEDPDWQLFQASVGNVLALSDRTVQEGLLTLRFYGRNPGTSQLRLYSAAKGLSLELTVEAGEDGLLTVSAHRMQAHPEWAGLEAEALDAYVVAGSISTPEGAEEVTWGRRSIARQLEAAVVSFRFLDVDWTVYVTASAELEDLVAQEFQNETILTLAVGGNILHACLRQEEGTVAAWCGDGARWYLIEGSGEVDLGRLLETANGLLTAPEANNDETEERKEENP